MDKTQDQQKKEKVPWASGPGEILRHGIKLFQKDSDTNRRLAMICIDNSVELMIKTYLGLPKRISGLQITRKEYAEFSESFPKLLDALEKFASTKIIGIDLGEVEWFHRLRNELYHQGNGLTVERTNVEVYAEMANVLFENLFGFPLIDEDEDTTQTLGSFISEWIHYEKTVQNLSFIVTEKRTTPLDSAKILYREGIISESQLAELHRLRQLRNEVVHGKKDHAEVLTSNDVKKLADLVKTIRKKTFKHFE